MAAGSCESGEVVEIAIGFERGAFGMYSSSLDVFVYPPAVSP